ncbi:MAG: type IV pili twitching motility protein PilT [Candidatus Doudnabacteria bacterium RIFCSPHIGHO2_01_FULL_50_11]|uniref:Type IV pili twitching motility protein PilT n=1 Tax=Candidatus Doudnabacteria bacterium RIFCSPHIGHO2_01_FULL_50_11 TaxID=1817828 RepID=A0A1F5PFA6_9BACT|nr:MAG: type IV pili twitching motility protein PilT [Candidatus Doudnabacteria bacterium RIFCSPHIGHO2_01_FULL_50_11]HLC44882.1 PilT/PilU family type 4a pilus ATPase [Patescibacteria group bacterium]
MYKNSELELSNLLSKMLQQDASDLHLIVGKPPIYRVHSRLLEDAQYDVMTPEHIESIGEVLVPKTKKEMLLQQRQTDFSYAYKDNHRLRVNAYFQKDTLAISIRMIPNKIKTLEELNLPDVLKKFTELKQGLVLVVGPTGHGKSTALASMIDMINTSRPEHIITVEDPIEYVFLQDKSIVSQREVLRDTMSFAAALTAALREDPNVVMVGEMRDLESISTTITIAETGHLVFATLHTNDAAQTIDRIVDVFPPHQQPQIRTQLASVLLGIISIRLLPRIGGGLIPAMEILFVDTAVRNVIRENRTFEIYNIIHSSGAKGMVSLDRYLSELVKKGLTTYDNALPYARDIETFTALVSR